MNRKRLEAILKAFKARSGEDWANMILLASTLALVLTVMISTVIVNLE